MTLHISESELHDYFDRALDDTTRTVAAQHLSVCHECSGRLDALERLRARLRTLPRSIEPVNDLLPGIRARTSAGEAPPIPFPTASQPMHGTRARWPLLAAAAVTLCVLSSAITLLLVRGGDQTQVATTPLQTGSAQLVGLQETEARYVDAIEELRRALLQDQVVLEPATMQLLEQSLATIDNALREARAALAADPGNTVLAEMLQANYEKKLDLLRRASVHARARL